MKTRCVVIFLLMGLSGCSFFGHDPAQYQQQRSSLTKNDKIQTKTNSCDNWCHNGWCSESCVIAQTKVDSK